MKTIAAVLALTLLAVPSWAMCRVDQQRRVAVFHPSPPTPTHASPIDCNAAVEMYGERRVWLGVVKGFVWELLKNAGSCSGHGLCSSNDACTCDPNFTGADCSERVCPFGLAHVDTPLGDLNHDGEITSATSTVSWANAAVNEMWPFTQNGAAHAYVECSGQGSCDRRTGECVCHDGTTGSACQRSECPNQCSGRGVCRTLSEIAAGTLNKRNIGSQHGRIDYDGVTESFDYNLWDKDVFTACICDPGYTGPDCSMRECPRGDDPITTGSRWAGNETPEVGKLKFTLTPGSPSVSILRFDFTGWDGRTMSSYATIDSQNDAPGVRDTTVTPYLLPGLSTIGGKITAALRSMPGGLLQSASAWAKSTCTPGAACTYFVELDNRPGKQNLLDVTVESGGVTVTTAPAWTQTSSRDVDGNQEEITCSSRGLCDYSTGLCACFQGYYGSACEFQSALAGGSSASGSSSGPTTTTPF